MTADDFLLFMEHFIEHMFKKYKSIILLVDNHQSHLLVRVTDLAKETGVMYYLFHLIALTD
jgi:hypothetical protein